MFNRKLLVVAAVSVIAAGCNGSDDGSLYGMGKAVMPLTAEFTVKDKFDQASNTFTAGENMVFELTVTNTGNAAVSYEFTPPGHDIRVMAGEDVIWSKYHGRIFTQAMQSGTLDAHEVLDLSVTWDGTDNQGNPVAPGEYEIDPWIFFSVGGATVPEPDAVTIVIN